MSDVIISVKDLTKQYMDQKAVNNASFQIKRGMICGLIGPNGAGKTTIMKTLGGLILPTSGSIELLGETTEAGLSNSRKRMSFMIETPYAKEKMTARENLEKQRLQKGIPDNGRIDEVLKIVGLEHTGKKLVKDFSLGMRQRLGIAIALLSRPEIMIMDEPINGLDPEGIVEIRELLLELNQKEKITIIISSHILSELSLLCTDYIFIQHGQIKKQLSAEALENECKQFYMIDSTNNELSVAVISEKLGYSDYEVLEDGRIKLYEGLEDLSRISRTLFENDIIPTELHLNEANLEQYYMDMVGESDEKHNKGIKLSE